MTPTEPSAQCRTEFAIVLPGFDYEEQLYLDFSPPVFSAAWLRRTYTLERDYNSKSLSHIVGRQDREAAVQQIRYGNNITVLFRACYRLSRFYGTSGFWPAVAQGWSVSPRGIEDVVDRFVRARRIYRKSVQRYDFHSGATIAADTWMRFIDTFRDRPGMYRPSKGIYEADAAASRTAAEFYQDSRTKFLQDDAAAVLSRRGIEETQRPARKRSPSPTPLEEHREAKRRASPEWFEKPVDCSASTGNTSIPPQPPLALDVGKKPEQAKQEYPTPTSVTRTNSDQHVSSPQAPPVEHHERKIRGIAHQESRSPTPKKSIEPVPESQSSVQTQEQEATGAQGGNSGHTQETIKIPTTTTVERAESGLVTRMQAKIESLEKRLLEAEVEREKDAGGAKALFASYEARMAELEESRSAQAVLMQKMQATLALMESKPATQDHSASVESEASINTALERNQKDMLIVYERLATLQEQGESLCRTIKGLSQAHASGLSPTPPEDIQRSMEDMARQVKALPTMNKLSEKAFQIEQHLQESLSEYRRDNDERVQLTVKDVETVQAQIRGLTKQFDKATACLPKTAILTAVQEQVARLSKRLVTVQEIITRDHQLVDTLADRVDKLSAQICDTSLASLPDRIQELSSKTNALEKKIEDAQTDTLKSLPNRVQNLSDKTDALEKKVEDIQAETQSEEEMASINARINVLTKSFLDLLDHLHRGTARTNAPGSSNQPSSPFVGRQPNAPQMGDSRLQNANSPMGAA